MVGKANLVRGTPGEEGGVHSVTLCDPFSIGQSGKIMGDHMRNSFKVIQLLVHHNKSLPKLARKDPHDKMESLQPMRSISAWSWPAPMFSTINSEFLVQFFVLITKNLVYLCPPVTD